MLTSIPAQRACREQSDSGAIGPLVLRQCSAPNGLARMIATFVVLGLALVGVGTASGDADGVWVHGPRHYSPSIRLGHTAIYDPLRKRLIVFGGRDDQRRNDVWSLSLNDSIAWQLLLPSGTPPSPRYSHAAIYDSQRDRMIVFGGDDGGDLNDVWALSLSDVPTWSQIETSGEAPVGRRSASAIYDPIRDQMVVFGGKHDSVSFEGDCWVLSLAGDHSWSQVDVPEGGPSSRYRHSAIYDPIRDRMIVFGGDDGAHDLNDTWALGFAPLPMWTQLSPVADWTLPTPRRGHTAVYDPNFDRMIIYGGSDPLTGDNATWSLSLAGDPAWIPISGWGPGAPRYRHAAAFDSDGDRMIVFGGENARQEVQAFDLSVEIPGIDGWSVLSMPQWPQAALYDPVRNRMIVLPTHRAGATAMVLPLAHESGWSRLGDELPPNAIVPRGIYDPLRDRMMAFGCGATLNEVWMWSFVGQPGWTKLTIPGPQPPGVEGSSAIYDQKRDRVIVFGGESDHVAVNEVWVLPLSGSPSWSKLSIDDGPSPRSHHTAVYDPVRDRMLVFGGSGDVLKSETWALALDEQAGGPRWSLLHPSGAAPVRCTHTAIYDPIRDRMVVFGGWKGSLGEDTNETWSLALSGMGQWSRLEPTGSLPWTRRGHVAIYDPVVDRMIIFGGTSPDDPWSLNWGEPVMPVALPIGEPSWTSGAPLDVRYSVSNPLPSERSIEWTLTSQFPWPDYPLRGSLILAGGDAETLVVHSQVPVTATSGSNTMKLSVAFGGAAGNETSCEHVVLDATTGTLFTLVSAEATVGKVRIVWRVANQVTASFYRRSESSAAWSLLNRRQSEPDGVTELLDEAIEPGARYCYRLAVSVGGVETVMDEVWLRIPDVMGLELLGSRPNPARENLVLEFTAPTTGRARFQLFDVLGRNVGRPIELETRAGRQVLAPVAWARLAAGVYVVRMTFGGRALSRRVVVSR